MQMHHYVFLLIVFVIGGVFARYFPQLFQKVGFP